MMSEMEADTFSLSADDLLSEVASGFLVLPRKIMM